MSVKSLLVVFASRHGQVERIARRISDVAIAHGVRQARSVDILSSPRSVADFDAIIVAGSVYFGRHAGRLRRFVVRNRPALEARPSAFVSVGMAAADPEGGSEVAKAVTRFLQETSWTPATVATFAGGLPYTRYNWLTRLVMQRIARKKRLPANTAHDYEFTDWKAVDAFVLEFLSNAAAQTAA